MKNKTKSRFSVRFRLTAHAYILACRFEISFSIRHQVAEPIRYPHIRYLPIRYHHSATIGLNQFRRQLNKVVSATCHIRRQK